MTLGANLGVLLGAGCCSNPIFSLIEKICDFIVLSQNRGKTKPDNQKHTLDIGQCAPLKNKLDEVLIDAAIKAALKQGPLNKTTLTNTVKENLHGMGINRIRNRIERMTAANVVLMQKGGGTEKLYQLR